MIRKRDEKNQYLLKKYSFNTPSTYVAIAPLPQKVRRRKASCC
ncbi:hypothetical protein [Calothrix sp. NIES-2098]